MKIRNAETLGTTKARIDALSILDTGLSAIDTETVLTRVVRRDGDMLVIDGTPYPLPEGKLVFVGIGKCAITGAVAIESILGDALSGGIALDVSMPAACRAKKIECIAGTHPLPSDGNIAATKHVLAALEALTAEDFALVLVSGGGSTLLCQPPASMTAGDEARVFGELTKHGATIEEINTVRRHLSTARGGWLAAAAHPARTIALIFSDVPGDDLSAISSGPTVYDATTIDDARAVLARYDVPLQDDFLIETPKDRVTFDNVTNVLALSNMTALAAMREAATLRGYSATIRDHTFSGEARDAGEAILTALREEPAPAVHLYGGETTVTIDGPSGKGGRNTELSLGALAHVREGEVLISIASDGHDNTDAAGGVCDTLTREKAHARGLDADASLTGHDAYTFFETTDDLISTGRTGSNVSDLIIALSS